MPTSLLVPPLVLALSLFSSAGDGDWPQFRGPGGRAVADDTPIPTDFGPERSVLWKTALPPGHSSPCIVEERIYVTGFEDGKDVLVALERGSGKALWRKTFEAPPEPAYDHPDGGPALSTPAADADMVVAYFGSYGLVACDPDGELLWEVRLPHPGYEYGVGTSPLLFDGLVILSRDGAPETAILAFDASDGSQLWRIDRFGCSESHGTPFLWRTPERDELVVGGTGKLCSYAPGTGELLWSVGGLTRFPCTSPTADEDTLFFAAWSTPNASARSFWEEALGRSLELSDAEIEDPGLFLQRLDADHDGKLVPAEIPPCRARDAFDVLDHDGDGAWSLEELRSGNDRTVAPGKNLMVAVARGAAGDATKDHVRWTWEQGLPYVSSPLCYRGRVWLVKAGGIVTCLDAKSGKPLIDRARLDDRSEYYATPVGAAGHVILASSEGTVVLLDAGAPELVVEHSAAFEEDLFATPAVLGGKLYLRTKSTLWAFGK